jgi:hypothetical protein
MFLPLVSAAGDVTDMTALKPVVRTSLRGIGPMLVGERAVLSTNVQNHLNETSTFAVIMEARDSDGVTQFLDSQFGLILPDSVASVGFSWTPEKAGTYEVRTFVVSGTVNPQVYSPVVSSYFTVE